VPEYQVYEKGCASLAVGACYVDDVFGYSVVNVTFVRRRLNAVQTEGQVLELGPVSIMTVE